MELEEAKALALQLMKQHGLAHWRFEFDGAKRRFGVCRYDTKTIGLSKHLVLLNTKERVTNTILHEIAHAAVGPGYGHSWVWQRYALAIGCDGMRCYTSEKVKMVSGNYEAICPKCGHIYQKYRLPKTKKSCGKCANVFDENRLLNFKRKDTTSDLH